MAYGTCPAVGHAYEFYGMNVSYQRVPSVSSGIREGDMTRAKLNKRLKTFLPWFERGLDRPNFFSKRG